MRRGLGCVAVLVLVAGLLGLLVWWLGWLPVAIVAAVLALLLFVLFRKGILEFSVNRIPVYPGHGVGVTAPESGVVTRLRSEQFPSLIKTVEDAEQGDPTARRVVDTIAVLRSDGVPRSFLRVPADEELDADEAAEAGFAGPQLNAVLDRLCEARLLSVRGERVVMDPTTALAVRLRAEDAGHVQQMIAHAANVLYTHAISIRLRANDIAYSNGDPAEAAPIAAEARALLDQAVTLAWYTQYTFDRAMDTILQCTTSLAEVGQFDDALVLTKQMAVLCSQRLGGVHPLTQEAQQSVGAIERLRSGQPGGSK